MKGNKMTINNWVRRSVLAAFSVAGVTATCASGDITGPSSSESPYLVRSKPGVVTLSVLTTGDAVNFKSDGVTPYRMVGIPDGLGAFDNGDGTFTLLLNHELTSLVGIARDHGLNGAFVSRWTIDKETLTVLHGEDLMTHAFTWDPVAKSYQPAMSAF